MVTHVTDYFHILVQYLCQGLVKVFHAVGACYQASSIETCAAMDVDDCVMALLNLASELIYESVEPVPAIDACVEHYFPGPLG